MAENTKLIFCKQIEGNRYLTGKWKFGQKGAWPRTRDLLLKFCYPANISGTAENRNQKFLRATSKYHDLLNKQATELGKIRESIALTSNTVTKCGLGSLTSSTKKAKINFQNW